MKQNVFKKLVKEAVREAIQEELKEILVEAIKAPKQTAIESTPPPINENSVISSRDRKAEYQNIMGDMRAKFTSQNVPQPFNPQGGMPGGDLPAGEVNMNQIMGLMNNK